jgi:hypothetical protein
MSVTKAEGNMPCPQIVPADLGTMPLPHSLAARLPKVPYHQKKFTVKPYTCLPVAFSDLLVVERYHKT